MNSIYTIMKRLQRIYFAPQIVTKQENEQDFSKRLALEKSNAIQLYKNKVIEAFNERDYDIIVHIDIEDKAYENYNCINVENGSIVAYQDADCSDTFVIGVEGGKVVKVDIVC